MKKLILTILLLLTVMIFCQQTALLSDEYYLWTGTGWELQTYEYNTTDSAGNYSERNINGYIYSRTDYDGYYQLKNTHSYSSEYDTNVYTQYYNYDHEIFLTRYNLKYETFHYGNLYYLRGEDIYYTYQDDKIITVKEIVGELNLFKDVLSNTLTEYTYNPDSSINSEVYSDSTSSGWVERSRILWSYDGNASTGIKEIYNGTVWIYSDKYDRVINENIDPVSEIRSAWNGSGWELDELDYHYYNSAGNRIKTVTFTYNSETGAYDLYSKKELEWNDGIDMNTVSGHAYLEGESVHSGIEVFFQRVVPDTLYNYSAYTDSTGFYSCQLEDGYYDIIYSKSGFSDIVAEDVVLYSDQTLADQTLTLSGLELEGTIKGILQKGKYNVTDTLTVLFGDSLIIEPGVVLNFISNTSFQINGFLCAEGTKSDSIYFSALDNWLGITLNSTCSGSIKNCSINKTIGRSIDISSSDFIISNSEINSLGNGIDVSNCSCEFELLKINGSLPNYAVKCEQSLLVKIENSEIFGFQTGIQNYTGGKLIVQNSIVQSEQAISTSYGVVYLNNVSIVSQSNAIFSDFSDSISVYNCNLIGIGYATWGIDICGSPRSLEVYNTNVYGFDYNFSNCGPYLGVIVTTNANGDSCDAYGNISMDPMFVDASSDNFRLLAGSPCIDAGINTIDGYTFPVGDIVNNYRIWDGDGNGSAIVDMGAYEYGAPVGIEDQVVEVHNSELYQNYPNPFNPVTTISYALPKAGQVELSVYNLNGQLVKSLVNGKMDKGMHKAEFNGNDLTSGMYIYNLKVDGKVMQSKKMMLLK